MGLLGTVGAVPPPPPVGNYSFVGSENISDFLKEFDTPKHDQGIDEGEGLDVLDSPHVEEKPELESLKMKTSVAKSGAAILAMAIDSGMSMIIGGVIAKDDPANYRADEEQRGEMQEALTEYLKLKGTDIPPGFALLIVVLSIYIPMGVGALRSRKDREKIAQQEKEIAELKGQLNKNE